MSAAHPALAAPHTPAAWRPAALLAGAFALLNLLAAGQVALGVDEAHYALYGALPDLSYFDHPPMVGWLQALALQFGESERVLRLWPIALSLAVAALVYRLTRELFPEAGPQAALAAVAGLQAAVMFQLLSLALLPEMPLLLFALCAALFLRRAVEGGGLPDFLLLGLFTGLAGLSKYTAVTLVASAFIYIALRRRWHVLRDLRLWAAVLLALAVISPVLLWNAQHDFISFTYQLRHGAPERGWSFSRFLTGQLYQLGAWGPGLYLLGWAALITALPRAREPGRALVVAIALPVLVLFGWAGGKEEGLPHWTALGWVMLLPLTAGFVLARWHRRAVRYLVYGSGGLSVLLIAVIHSALLLPWLPFQPYRHPLGDVIGWREAARAAVQLRAELSPDTPLMVANWSHASRIAWYARPVPVQVVDSRFDQFDLWYGTPLPGAAGLLVLPEAEARRQDGARDRFSWCEERQTLPITQGDSPIHTFHLYVCLGYRG